MSGKKKETTVVVSQTEIATDIYDMWIATDLSLQAKPGQFISVYTQDKSGKHNGHMGCQCIIR